MVPQPPPNLHLPCAPAPQVRKALADLEREWGGPSLQSEWMVVYIRPQGLDPQDKVGGCGMQGPALAPAAPAQAAPAPGADRTDHSGTGLVAHLLAHPLFPILTSHLPPLTPPSKPCITPEYTL